MATQIIRHGTVRWLERPTLKASGSLIGVLRITRDNDRDGLGTVYGVILEGQGRVQLVHAGLVYHVDTVAGTCDCPDARHAGAECKHVNGSRVALAALVPAECRTCCHAARGTPCRRKECREF